MSEQTRERIGEVIPKPNGIEIRSKPLPFNPGFYWTDPDKKDAKPVHVKDFQVRLLSMGDWKLINACEGEEDAARLFNVRSIVRLGPVVEPLLMHDLIALMIPSDHQRIRDAIARLEREFSEPEAATE